jgi:hypothetical protein
VGHIPKDKIVEFFKYAVDGGSKGISLFSIEGIDKNEGYWDSLGVIKPSDFRASR